MHEFTIGALVGVSAGVASAALAAMLHKRRSQPLNTGEATLSDEDRVQLADEFRIHAQAVHRQVSEYADALAANDPQLRSALRQIEKGQAWVSS